MSEKKSGVPTGKELSEWWSELRSTYYPLAHPWDVRARRLLLAYRRLLKAKP